MSPLFESYKPNSEGRAYIYQQVQELVEHFGIEDLGAVAVICEKSRDQEQHETFAVTFVPSQAPRLRIRAEGADLYEACKIAKDAFFETYSQLEETAKPSERSQRIDFLLQGHKIH